MFYVEKSDDIIHVKSRHDISNKFEMKAHNGFPCLIFYNANLVILKLIIKPDNLKPIYLRNEITLKGNVESLTWYYQSVELYKLY